MKNAEGDVLGDVIQAEKLLRLAIEFPDLIELHISYE
jgi:hypothetical protein